MGESDVTGGRDPALVVPLDEPGSGPRQEAINRRFLGGHGRWSPFSCGAETYLMSSPGGLQKHCAHEGLLIVASILRTGPPAPVVDLEGRMLRGADFGFDPNDLRWIEVGALGEALGPCACPHDCAWSGPLREMWVRGGFVVCPECHDAWADQGHQAAWTATVPGDGPA